MTDRKQMSTLPRVIRTPLVTTNALIVGGVMFEDGKRRLFVPIGTTDEVIAEATVALEERDAASARIDRTMAAIEAVLSTIPVPVEEDNR